MVKALKFFSFLILVIYISNLQAQIKIRELPAVDYSKLDSTFFNGSVTREIVHLNNGWKVYPPGEKENQLSTVVPASFEGVESLIFEKEFILNETQINSYQIKLIFLGVNYFTELFVNDLAIYKHPGGELPFSVELPKDVLSADKPNKLAVKIIHELDSEDTIPLKQRFLFPKNTGGIFREVYLQFIPNNRIANVRISYNISDNFLKADFEIEINLFKSSDVMISSDSIVERSYHLKYSVLTSFGEEVLSTDKLKLIFEDSGNANKKYNFALNKLNLWSPNSPSVYKVKFQFFAEDNIIDEITKFMSIYSLRNDGIKFLLNGSPFYLSGTTYCNSFQDYGNLNSLSQIQSDLNIIKYAGFNAVRFTKSIPHPYALQICNEIGLFAFIENPINSVPEEISAEQSFKDRALSYLLNIIRTYSEYQSVAAIGVGSSFISNSTAHSKFIEDLATHTKANSNKLVYASFVDFPKQRINNVDFYGAELLSKSVDEYSQKYDEAASLLGSGRVFISEATYPTYAGGTNGYLNRFSFEAQAKFIEDLINLAASRKIPAYFINSMFDYRGDFTSLYTGYDENNLYRIGILGEDRITNRLAYKVIDSRLNRNERVTIPIGDKKDDSPLFFILFGLGLAVVMALIINSKKKLRENATRALLRPYNFYADIRDHRILTGPHTNLLMLILAGSHSLLITSLLYFFKNNILLEKVLISLGIPEILSVVSFLAWNPVQAFIYLFITSILLFLLISIIIAASTFFIKTKVIYSSIYFVVIWSFLPVALLLPLELVLYRILESSSINVYIFIFLVVYFLWVIQRLMKGIYVIFDVRPSVVYFYSFLLIVLSIGVVLLYFQLTESSIYYIINAVKQHRLS